MGTLFWPPPPPPTLQYHNSQHPPLPQKNSNTTEVQRMIENLNLKSEETAYYEPISLVDPMRVRLDSWDPNEHNDVMRVQSWDIPKDSNKVISKFQVKHYIRAIYIIINGTYSQSQEL